MRKKNVRGKIAYYYTHPMHTLNGKKISSSGMRNKKKINVMGHRDEKKEQYAMHSVLHIKKSEKEILRDCKHNIMLGNGKFL